MESNHTSISDVGEFGLIDRMQLILGEPRSEQLLLGISDDAAVYRVNDLHAHVVSTDMLLEGVHFDLSFMPLPMLGRKAISVNVSDVVAMNAVPKYALVSIALPPKISVEMVEDIYRGIRAACDDYGVIVVGGDTSMARQLTISVTMIGEAAIDALCFRRGARAGDMLFVSGTVGGAYAGLKVLLDEHRKLREDGEEYTPDVDAYRYPIGRQLNPQPRLDLVHSLADAGVKPKAMIDISDGFASEVSHICAQSMCGAVLNGASLPVHADAAAVADRFGDNVEQYALFGGEDYELLFAVDPEDAPKLDGLDVTSVGILVDGSEGIRIRRPSGEVVDLQIQGWDHFG